MDRATLDHFVRAQQDYVGNPDAGRFAVFRLITSSNLVGCLTCSTEKKTPKQPARGKELAALWRLEYINQ